MSPHMFTDAAQFLFIRKGNAEFQVTEHEKSAEKLQATLFLKFR